MYKRGPFTKMVDVRHRRVNSDAKGGGGLGAAAEAVVGSPGRGEKVSTRMFVFTSRGKEQDKRPERCLGLDRFCAEMAKLSVKPPTLQRSTLVCDAGPDRCAAPLDLLITHVTPGTCVGAGQFNGPPPHTPSTLAAGLGDLDCALASRLT